MMNQRLAKLFFGLVALTALTGCTAMKPNDFALQKPKLVIEDYFSGKTRAWGIFEDRFGKVRRQFVVDIDGVWDGTTLTLDEHFEFNDGEKSFRQWRIRKLPDGGYEGEADDVVGTATGIASGNALNWTYVLDLKTGEDSTLRVRFDDWMFLQRGGVLLNRARMSKFGIDLGAVTISFMKLQGTNSDQAVSLERPAREAVSVAAQ
jgi:hypothetical protein